MVNSLHLKSGTIAWPLVARLRRLSTTPSWPAQSSWGPALAAATGGCTGPPSAARVLHGRAAVKPVGLEHIGYAAIDPLDHAAGSRRPGLGQPLLYARRLVSRHGSDVVGCAQPSERSARRIAQPIPSCIGKGSTAAMRFDGQRRPTDDR